MSLASALITLLKNWVFQQLLIAGCVLALAACGGGGGDDGGGPARGSNAGTNCSGQCADASSLLTAADVSQVLAQAVAQAQAMNQPATIAVVDRVGNVLAVFRMNGVLAATDAVTITSGTPIDGGLEGLNLPVNMALPGDGALDGVGDGLAAIAKAITAAYLSSEGNGFSTRTANQIVQRHFNPGEDNQPSGPLFGVQFSQLPCGDFVRRQPSTVGPKRSPLGLSADPGGLPLYKNGTPVGGVGVVSDFVYGLDRNVLDFDSDPDEIIALAATFGFAVPIERKANRITIEGKQLRFADVDFDAVSTAARNAAPPVVGVDGGLLAVRGYFDPAGGILAGQAFGQPGSGIRPDTNGDFPGRDAFVFVDDANQERFPPTAGTAPAGLALTANEVRVILDQALGVANQARAQIRRPLGSTARVTISVVDTAGNILGMARTRDAPVFGADVSLQKARTATLFTSMDAAAYIRSLPDAQYLTPVLLPARTIDFDDYVDAVEAFFNNPLALSNGIAFSDRAGGNISRPNFPDGINEPPLGPNPPGPLSKPPGEWSPFSTGLQLDASFNAVVSHLLFVFGLSVADVGKNCVGVPFGATMSMAAPRVANGTQIFPGSVPIYRGNTLVGGIGVSGDGIDQDDMISFLGLHRASLMLGSGIQNAPPTIRADELIPVRSDECDPKKNGGCLRYVNCPQTPFVGSDEQGVCHGK